MSGEQWRRDRGRGIAAIALSAMVTLGLWLTIQRYGPVPADMGSLAARMIFTLKCVCVATLFAFVPGIEAVAHERLRSPAFDPLQGVETRRLRVNQRYLQNTLEQLVVFAVGLFGLAAYATDGAAMRAVTATTVVWVAGRVAFWIGYHHSAAMRGAGVPGMFVSLLTLIYVAARVGGDVAGTVGMVTTIGAFLVVEAVLFRATRRGPAADGASFIPAAPSHDAGSPRR